MKRNRFLRFLAVAALAVVAAVTHAAPPVIAHQDHAAEKLDAAGIKAVFLGKKVAWDGGGRITLAVLKGGPVADEFCQTHLGMNASQFQNHWRRLALTGGGIAPKTFDSEDELKKFVASTPGAVGFVGEAVADDSVAILAGP